MVLQRRLLALVFGLIATPVCKGSARPVDVWSDRAGSVTRLVASGIERTVTLHDDRGKSYSYNLPGPSFGAALTSATSAVVVHSRGVYSFDIDGRVERLSSDRATLRSQIAMNPAANAFVYNWRSETGSEARIFDLVTKSEVSVGPTHSMFYSQWLDDDRLLYVPGELGKLAEGAGAVLTERTENGWVSNEVSLNKLGLRTMPDIGAAQPASIGFLDEWSAYGFNDVEVRINGEVWLRVTEPFIVAKVHCDIAMLGYDDRWEIWRADRVEKKFIKVMEFTGVDWRIINARGSDFWITRKDCELSGEISVGRARLFIAPMP